MPPLRLPTLVLACLVAVAALAPAADAKTRHLWSTINICDSPKHPDAVGVAARMPGDGTNRRMYMRFYVQYRGDDGKWRYVPKGGRSPWMSAGSARYSWSQRGYTFGFDPPATGAKFVMRGLVRYEWRRGKKVIKKTHRYTSAGHTTKGADPAGYSSATCTLEGPPPQPPQQPPYQDPNAQPQG